MKLNTKKFFELAKDSGLQAADVFYSRSYSLSVEVFRKEVSSFTLSDNSSLLARGIFNGKFGCVNTEIIDKTTPQFLVDSIIKSATLVEKDDPSIIFEGSKKYAKRRKFDKSVLSKDIKNEIEILFEIEKKLLAYDKRITEVSYLMYGEGSNEHLLQNSYGLKLKDASADYYYVAEVTVKENDEVKTNFDFFASNKAGEFKVDEFVEKVAKGALNKLGGIQCKSKKYPVILNPECASILTSFYLGSTSAEEVQKKSSLFINKLNAQVASKKVTIIENPLLDNMSYRYFDDEGVATKKKDIIKKGILQTYLYNLETASKDNVEPTGNGYRSGSKVYTSFVNAYIKPGKKTQEEMYSTIKEGLLITSLEGLHAGMNAKSGNFSLQAQGFMIKDGKLAEPVSLITVAGNLVELFMNIKEVGSDSKYSLNSPVIAPSLFIKKLSVTGK